MPCLMTAEGQVLFNLCKIFEVLMTFFMQKSHYLDNLRIILGIIMSDHICKEAYRYVYPRR